MKRLSQPNHLFSIFHKSRSASINQKLLAAKLSEMLTLLLENNKFWCRDFTSKVLTLSRVKLVTNPKRFNWDCSQVTLKFLVFSPLFEALRKKLLSHSLSLTPFLSHTPSHSLFLTLSLPPSHSLFLPPLSRNLLLKANFKLGCHHGSIQDGQPAKLRTTATQ